MIKTPKGKEYGKRMQVLSHMYINKWTKKFRGTQWEEKDIRMVYDDACNLYLIGTYLIDGNINAALNVADEVDTLVRDEIPRSIYNYLCKYSSNQD